MSLQDQAEHLWLTKGQKPHKDQQNLLDPFALYGFFTNNNEDNRPYHRRAKSAMARTNSPYETITKNRNHPPGYKTPALHVGHMKNPNPTPVTSRPASSRSGYSSVKSRKMDHSCPTALYLGSRCKSAPVKPRKFIPRRPTTSKPGSRVTSAATSRGAPQRAWELRTNSATTHKSLLSPKEVHSRQKERCKSAPLPYDFSKIELINEIPQNGTEYDRLHAMTRPLSCMPDLVKNAVTHNGLRHCCSAYNTRTTVPRETRQQFWPIARPGVYRRGFVPQYFSFVNPIRSTGESSSITYTKPAYNEPPYSIPQDFDDTVLFEESFAIPATPSELSMSDQYDLSDNDEDIMNDFNVQEYLQSGIVSDPDDYDDELQLSSEPTPEQLQDIKHLKEDIWIPEIEVEITMNQSRQSSPALQQTPEPQINEPEKQDDYDKPSILDEQLENQLEQQERQPVHEEPVDESNNTIDTEPVITVEKLEIAEENIPEVESTVVQESKSPLPPTPHPDPPRVTFVDSITVTSYKPPETTVPSKPILKQPKPQPPMEVKPLAPKKPPPRPMVERREADIRPQIKPGIILKPEPPRVQRVEKQEEEKVEPKPLEEKLPEPEFVQAPGAYRMYQSVDLYQHDLQNNKAKAKKLLNRASQMPLPYSGISLSHHHMMPESSSVVNAVIENEKRKKEGMKPWLQGRLALSKQTSRFELPMDVKDLESMSAMEYLTKYCIISTRRKALYKHVFQKVDKDRDGIIGFRELEKGLRDIHVDSIEVKEVHNIVEMIGADEKTKFNLKQFSAIAALSERILFSNFVTEETKNINSTKEIIEEADFCSLKWKLDGFNVNPTVRRILESL